MIDGAPAPPDEVSRCVAWLDEHDVSTGTGINKVEDLCRDDESGALLFKRVTIRGAVLARRDRTSDFTEEHDDEV